MDGQNTIDNYIMFARTFLVFFTSIHGMFLLVTAQHYDGLFGHLLSTGRLGLRAKQ